MMASKCWLIPEKSKQPCQLFVSIAVESVSDGQTQCVHTHGTPVENPRAFNVAAAAMTAGEGAGDDMDCMMTAAASAP